jgi:hypothetical protein
VLPDLDARPIASRAIACALFLLVLAAFTLPFAVVAADLRRAEGNGIEFAIGEPKMSGHYVHDSYEGEVERLVDYAQPVALAALLTLLAGVLLVWIPWKWGPAAGITFAALGLGALVWFHQAVNSAGTFAGTEYRGGYWISLGLVLVAGVWSVLLFVRTPFWWRADTGPRRDYFTSSDEY